MSLQSAHLTWLFDQHIGNSWAINSNAENLIQPRNAYLMDGKRRIESRMSRTLMGADDLEHPVTSCVLCNLAEGDRTAIDFPVATWSKDQAAL